MDDRTERAIARAIALSIHAADDLTRTNVALLTASNAARHSTGGDGDATRLYELALEHCLDPGIALAQLTSLVSLAVVLMDFYAQNRGMTTEQAIQAFGLGAAKL